VAEKAIDPRWSPDGARIAFEDWTTIATTGKSSVSVIKADGTGCTTVVSLNNAAVGNPQWAPDGNHLVYRMDRHHDRFYWRKQYIYRVAADGSGNTKLIESNWALALGWRAKEAAPPTPGITVEPTSGLVTTEAGDSDTFTIVLDTQPTAAVTVDLSSSDATEGTVAPASVTFDASNWDTPQTVTVTGVDDAAQDGDVAYSIVTAAAVSDDADYSGLSADDVGVTNQDDEAPPVPTSVTVTSITYSTEGGRNSDKHLVITVTVEDDLGNRVPGASLSIDVSLDGQHYANDTAPTGADGTVTFRLGNAPSGTYTTEVTAVAAEGLIWDGTTPPNEFTK
jgi:hypothetical protein